MMSMDFNSKYDSYGQLCASLLTDKPFSTNTKYSSFFTRELKQGDTLAGLFYIIALTF